MSRTTLCVLTAGVLAALSVGVSIVRYRVMGREIKVPPGLGTYKVTMLVRGKSAGDAKLITLCPLDFQRQHIFGEEFASDQLNPKIVELRQGERRQLQWAQRLGTGKRMVQARYEFFATVDVPRPSTSMKRVHKILHAAPRPGEQISPGPGIDPSDQAITSLALELTSSLEKVPDQVRALFHHVEQKIRKEPGLGGSGMSASECLVGARGDALAQSRLLVALCRNRGIPARLVTGLLLGKSTEQTAHTWVEAWVGDYWMPLCPFYHHCGRVPGTYLVFGYGDQALVRGHNLRDLDYACLVENKNRNREGAAAEVSPLQRFFTRISLYNLPPAEWRLVEFLLLLPLAALIICFFRNVIGLESFGTFAPALIGLAFRELESLPGILIFVSIVLVGWGMRRIMDRYHLLQVPRTAFMLSLVVVLLIALIVTANFKDLSATRYISLFPLVILTGMIERFWTLESEDGTWASFKTLLCTILIAAVISVVASLRAVLNHLVNYPETIGVIMACQLLIGRYTGYRLSELFRFRDFVRHAPDQVASGEHTS